MSQYIYDMTCEYEIRQHESDDWASKGQRQKRWQLIRNEIDSFGDIVNVEEVDAFYTETEAERAMKRYEENND